MKNFILFGLILFLLLGCHSPVQTLVLEQISHYSSGESMGRLTGFYWYTEKSFEADSGGDYVSIPNYGWYKTDYRWVGGVLRELVRRGEQLKLKGLIPYHVHVRFDGNSEPVYQQYRLAGKIFPLNKGELLLYQQKAAYIVDKTKESEGLELIQGFWDGSVLRTCSGQVYDKINFKQTLPDFVFKDLSFINSYIAFLGKATSKQVFIKELLLLEGKDHVCVERPIYL
ncbi:ATP synthase subunit a [Candidatus Photodesmus blepharus]|uniref:ATP synthase subunit a n=1 Tax=Candidatus Photodesmus blepharonis TaxID=1179155 RepID=A0A084CNE4_9GAMM|nr:DUF1481 domain-containing protein [Candidatus Photodesmus blepharus]KEY91323.1 ATP synthase subunit a [Candidatus Photodesmus blepharus]